MGKATTKPRGQPKRGRGRPEAARPKRHQVAFRVDDETLGAIEKYRERLGIVSFSAADTVREMMLRALKAEGLLK